MHAMTLDKLEEHLKKGKTALDIGTGSGYIAACFAELMPKDAKVIMVDHISSIVENAINNIKKDNKHLFKYKKIVSLIRDARKGIPEYGPYDVIHVGGAVDKIPDEYID
jgi:protein-L-isoaspartate(D-aspartate) O-methyltransferase